MRTLTLLCLFSSCYCIFAIGPEQTVGVMGKLLCNGKPVAGVKIKLYGKGLIDKKLVHVETDDSGSFKISGTAKELSKIDPKLNIYHRCNYKGPCYKKLSMEIPSKYISEGKQVKQYFNIITLELATEIKGQKTACIN